MGWSYGWRSRDEVTQHLLTGFAPGVSVLRHSLVGNHLWMLLERRTDAGAPRRAPLLCLLQGGRSEGWGYKDVGGTPFYVDCPLAIATGVTEDVAMERPYQQWLATVRGFHAAQRAQRARRAVAFAAGETVYVDGRKDVPVVIEGPYPPKPGWWIVSDAGRRVRVRTTRLFREGDAPAVASAYQMFDARTELEVAWDTRHANDFVVTSAWGDWHDRVPAGMVGCYALRGGHSYRTADAPAPEEAYFLVPKTEYETRATRGFVIDETRHARWTGPDDASTTKEVDLSSPEGARLIGALGDALQVATG